MAAAKLRSTMHGVPSANNTSTVRTIAFAIIDALPAANEISALTSGGGVSAHLPYTRDAVKVIAYNYGPTAVKTVTFTWRSVPTSVDVFAENRAITPLGATFTDDFGPYEAHVYIVR